jgi:ankyrin repeat protein
MEMEFDIPDLLKEFLTKGNNFRLLEQLKKNSDEFECVGNVCYDILTNYLHVYPLEVLSQYCNCEISEIIFFLSSKLFREQKISKRIVSLKSIIIKDNVNMIKLCMKYNIIHSLFNNVFLYSEREIMRYAFIFSSYRIIRYFLNSLGKEAREKFQIGKHISYIGKSSIDKFIHLFIEYNLNLESSNDIGFRLIHYVCRDGRVRLFNLIADKVDLNAVDNRGSGVLHHACFDENVELVKELIARKIDINSRDNNEFTPFNVACLNGYIEIVKLLIENGAVMTSPSYITSLNIACRSNNTNIVKLLLNKGLDPNITYNKSLPINIACYNQNIELIKILLLKTKNIDVKDNLYLTPLEIAIQRNNLDMVKLVVDGFISDKIYRINTLSCIHSIPLKYIEDLKIHEKRQSKIEIHRKTIFSTRFSFFKDLVIITA